MWCQTTTQLGSCLGSTPQCIALGPLLILIYVNDIPLKIHAARVCVDINDDMFNLLCGSTQSVILPPINVDGHLLECGYPEVFGPAYRL